MSRYKRELRGWVTTVIVAIIIAVMIKFFVFEIIEVDGDSMMPTLANDEKLIINKLVYIVNKPHPRDIIVFEYPYNQGFQLIKRVIAVEGDTIEITDGHVVINGRILEESYIWEKATDDFYKRVVPKNTVFVLGDNRNNSKDSRFEDIGFIPIKLVKGRAEYVIWPIKKFRKLL